MACCKPCCGCADCEEGQQGKCCCGGSSGTCCQEGEYCCSGACSANPCGSPCDVYTDCEYNVLGGCTGCDLEGLLIYFPNTAQGLADALVYPGTEDCTGCTVDTAYGSCCNDSCYPAAVDLPVEFNDPADFTNGRPTCP